ncbi:hypothetical protein ACS0TY_027289 [Phlomoides rotata]
MEYQDNLNKVAEEFAMIDEFYRQMRMMEGRPQENPVQTPPKTIDSKQAAKRYGGFMEVTGRRPGVQQGEGHPKQGGVWVMDYSKRKSKVMVC